MISLYFGLPGCGKTTLMVKHAIEGCKQTKRYKNIYCNVNINVPGVQLINKSDLMKFDIHDGLVLIDEAA